jgi:aldehyde dehydrogenase (NAD+)
VDGDGPTVGQAIASHPGINMVSFTGSVRAGVEVARAAAATVKRVTQELGGKSANVILRDADFERAVKAGVLGCFQNSGQSCDAPTRMLVPHDRLDDVVRIAQETAKKVVVGDPKAEGTSMGPLVGRQQFNRVQGLILKGIEEGAEAVVGGPGRPEGLARGYYVRPTVLAMVTPAMTVAREEIFGPVLSILTYRDEDEAVRVANDTPYGLSGYVWSADEARARNIASRLRTGMVHLNGAGHDIAAPFGGYRQSGNGREWGAAGIEEFLETKAILGYSPAPAR